MSADTPGSLGIWQELTLERAALVLAVILAARLLSFVVRWLLRHTAERAPPRLRLAILRLVPVARLLIAIGAIVILVPLVIEPTFRNLVTLLASVALALAFVLKDLASCVVGGLTAVLENVYQPGDWIEMAGHYGEVTAINLRATHLVTADDTEIIIPHSYLWKSSIANATSGNRGLLCIAHFYLHPDHDAAQAQRCLVEVADTSSYRKPGTSAAVIVTEMPWGTDYKLKAYVKESRDQFYFITDLTVRGKAALRARGMRFAQAPYAETGAPSH